MTLNSKATLADLPGSRPRSCRRILLCTRNTTHRPSIPVKWARVPLLYLPANLLFTRPNRQAADPALSVQGESVVLPRH